MANQPLEVFNPIGQHNEGSSGRGRRGGNRGWYPIDGREYNRRNDYEDRGFNNIKVTLPLFKGSSDPNEYVDGIVKLKRQYNLNNVSDVKKVNYAISHLEGFASTWWDKIERDALLNRNFVTSWHDIKRQMRKRFVGQDYEQNTLKKYYNLQQGSKSVEEYYEELKHTRLRANVNDEEVKLVARFILGLNKEKSSPTWDKSKGAKQELKSNFDKGKSKEDYTDGGNKSKLETPSKIKCFKCQGYGHKENEYPNRRTIIALNDDGYQTKDKSKEGHIEDDSSDEFMGEGDGEEINDDGKLVLVVRRSMSALAREDIDQRENLFHNWCRVQEQLCFFIIDSGSCVNVASVSMVEQLKLPIRRHPKPYRLQCLNECGELKDYEDLFSEEILSGLPPLRGIEHEIDFLPSSQIPNKAAYRSNPQETKELQRQVEELVNKGLVRESLSPCAVSVILVPKKDGTWRNSRGVEVDDEKVEAIRSWPTPTSISDVRSFYGLASFYRRFVKRFSSLAAPLTEVIKKDKPFIWGRKQEEAFRILK
ncbi:uncharacterized protein LOC107844200 [Capsicum annuum]|uniref:uncharacterized protein LOC107844200 n=1 Tax=Capsicum annuum TaxID=4072 RepID=UPI001FB0FF28|nr:uncharacterized protein LOC107844200 [Capsicum annuum]